MQWQLALTNSSLGRKPSSTAGERTAIQHAPFNQSKAEIKMSFLDCVFLIVVNIA